MKRETIAELKAKHKRELRNLAHKLNMRHRRWAEKHCTTLDASKFDALAGAYDELKGKYERLKAEYSDFGKLWYHPSDVHRIAEMSKKPAPPKTNWIKKIFKLK